MKQFIKLFSILVVLSLIALIPSQAQQFTVDLYVNGVLTSLAGQPVWSPEGTVATFTVFTDPSGIFTDLLTVEATGGVVVPPPTTGPVQVNHKVTGKGNVSRVITVDAAAVPAHLRHGDTYVEVTGPPPVTKATVTATAPDANGYVTITVSGVDMNVKVTFNWHVGG